MHVLLHAFVVDIRREVVVHERLLPEGTYMGYIRGVWSAKGSFNHLGKPSVTEGGGRRKGCRLNARESLVAQGIRRGSRIISIHH